MPKEKSCGAIIFIKSKEGYKYLLLHYQAGHWDFPKGHQEQKEKEEQTALREVREETGIESIDFADGFNETIKYFFKKGNETVYKEAVFFLAQSMTDKVMLSTEHIGYAWVNFDHAMKKLTFNNSKDLLQKANNFLMKKT